MKWKMGVKGGGWRVASGEWRVASGEWRVGTGRLAKAEKWKILEDGRWGLRVKG
jgi:hypothetical protein